MNIVLIAPSGSVTTALDQLDLDDSAHAVTVVSRVAPEADVRSIIITPALRSWSDRFWNLLKGSAAGRNLMRLGPLDHGRRFAGAALRNRDFRAAAQAADLIVVLERDGILTGWRAAHRIATPSALAVNGVAPARALIAARTGETSP